MQTVNATIALNYSVRPDSTAKLYQEVGVDYKVTIIDPAIQESLKAATAKFTAEELITHREEVKEQVQTTLSERLAQNGILVEQFSIVDFKFSESFETAIEAKVTAEQNALASKNKLEQVKYEAQQKIETAKADAEAIKIQAQAVNSQGGADYVQLQFAKVWDGHLPTTMIPGGSLPFLNIK